MHKNRLRREKVKLKISRGGSERKKRSKTSLKFFQCRFAIECLSDGTCTVVADVVVVEPVREDRKAQVSTLQRVRRRRRREETKTHSSQGNFALHLSASAMARAPSAPMPRSLSLRSKKREGVQINHESVVRKQSAGLGKTLISVSKAPRLRHVRAKTHSRPSSQVLARISRSVSRPSFSRCQTSALYV